MATWPDYGDDATEPFAAADQRLYAAKEAGRERIVLPPAAPAVNRAV